MYRPGRARWEAMTVPKPTLTLCSQLRHLRERVSGGMEVEKRNQGGVCPVHEIGFETICAHTRKRALTYRVEVQSPAV